MKKIKKVQWNSFAARSTLPFQCGCRNCILGDLFTNKINREEEVFIDASIELNVLRSYAEYLSVLKKQNEKN